jgi:hypothetical protein
MLSLRSPERALGQRRDERPRRWTSYPATDPERPARDHRADEGLSKLRGASPDRGDNMSAMRMAIPAATERMNLPPDHARDWDQPVHSVLRFVLAYSL